jgi:hypothetical protein
MKRQSTNLKIRTENKSKELLENADQELKIEILYSSNRSIRRS